MGGDASPKILFEAVRQAAKLYAPSITCVVLATAEVVEELRSSAENVQFCVASDVIVASDDPLIAVRRKKNSSLMAGIRLLKKRQIKALVSIGNTGALIAAATLSLPLKAGIKRPALL